MQSLWKTLRRESSFITQSYADGSFHYADTDTISIVFEKIHVSTLNLVRPKFFITQNYAGAMSITRKIFCVKGTYSSLAVCVGSGSIARPIILRLVEAVARDVGSGLVAVLGEILQ